MLQSESFAIGLEVVASGEGLLGQGLCGGGVEMRASERAVWSSIQDRKIMRLGHILLSVWWRLRPVISPRGGQCVSTR
jgi:hypothetical protein